MNALLRLLACVVCMLALTLLPGCPQAAELRANFSATPVTGVAPLVVNFSDKSTPGKTAIANWYWNFGDAETGTDQNPLHTYASVGQYTVTLRVLNANSESITTQRRLITVIPPPVKPTASFTASAEQGYTPLIVQFTDTSAPGDRAITTWRWDFGDGARSSQRNPAHTYDVGGTYDVSLTASNSTGEDTQVQRNLITVYPEEE